MSHKLFNGATGQDQALDRLSQKLGMPVIFKTASQWRLHSRVDADGVLMDQAPVCQIELRDHPRFAERFDLEIAALPSSNIFGWIYTSNDIGAAWKNARCTSAFHLEVLPTRRFQGYFLRLSRRLCPPKGQQGEKKFGELGSTFMRVTSMSFKELTRSKRTELDCPKVLVELVRTADKLVLRLDGALCFPSAIFHNGTLTKPRFPNFD